MSKLKAIPKADAVLPAGPPAVIGVGLDGRLQIHCDDDVTYEMVSGLLANRLFVQGHGFPVFQRDASGRLVRDPETNRLVLDGYADLSAPAERLLRAIEDNLEATGQFDLQYVE